MNQYYSQLVVLDYSLYPPPPYKGRGWHITFEDYPKLETAKSSAVIDGKKYSAKPLIIHARSLVRAQYANDLIFASFILWRGQQTPFFPFQAEVLPLQDKHLDLMCEQPGDMAPPHFSSMNIPTACLIAKKASSRRAYQYAIFKYLLSQEVFPTSQFDLDPSRWHPSTYVFDFADHVTRCAYAIVIGYSVLEELSIEIRASSKRPSYKHGEWNPQVRQDLEDRLHASGINPRDPIPWVERHTPTRIERRKPPPALMKSQWSGGLVRDVEMELADAIAYASWLRSKISAHRFRKLAGSLTYYDVSNVQNLARQLLLERLGYWKQSGQTSH